MIASFLRPAISIKVYPGELADATDYALRVLAKFGE